MAHTTYVTTLSGVRIPLFALALAFAAMSCVRGRTVPEPAISSLSVHNRTFFDVEVFALPSLLARPIRMGTVVGGANAEFALHAHDLQPGGFLVVEVHAVGTVGSWTSDAVAVSGDERAILEVNADAFGDCSTSALYTALRADTVRLLSPRKALPSHWRESF